VKLLSQFFSKWIPISFLFKKLLLKFYVNGFPYLFILLKNSSSQVIYKLVPMSYFLKIFVKLQAINPTHEQVKSIQSSIQSTQVWSSINNSYFWTNPLPPNPIDSNQLSLKLWLEINHALEASWKYLNNHVWWCCVRLYLCVVLILIGGLFAGYNENGSTNNVKVMSHANMLLWAMDHPPPTRMYVILTLKDDAFKDVVH